VEQLAFPVALAAHSKQLEDWVEAAAHVQARISTGARAGVLQSSACLSDLSGHSGLREEGEPLAETASTLDVVLVVAAFGAQPQVSCGKELLGGQAAAPRWP